MCLLVTAVAEVLKNRDLPKATEHRATSLGLPFFLLQGWQPAGTPWAYPSWDFRERRHRNQVKSLLIRVSAVHAGLTIENAALCSNPREVGASGPQPHAWGLLSQLPFCATEHRAWCLPDYKMGGRPLATHSTHPPACLSSSRK